MSEISYGNAPYPVRVDFSESHNRYWTKLAAPGTWLSGAERVAVAKEVRQAPACALCRRRKEALSPYQVDGDHDTVTDLPALEVEVIHRVITDSSRLTKSWFDSVMRQGLAVERYVEVLGVSLNVFSIDEFCRGLGLEQHALPEPQPGEPSKYRPANIIEDGDGAWVPLLPIIIESGPESDLWEDRTGNVVRALTLVPDEVRHMLELSTAHYLDVDHIWDFKTAPHGTLSRMQMEVIAARVSAFNGCFY